MNVCCGGIVGMGESHARSRADAGDAGATCPQHPESVPINQLVRCRARRSRTRAAIDPFDFVRTIAVARIMMPQRAGAAVGRPQQMSDELQALAFLAGANSIFYGEKLLTTGNPDVARDRALLARLGMRPEGATPQSCSTEPASRGERCGEPLSAAANIGRASDCGSSMRRDRQHRSGLCSSMRRRSGAGATIEAYPSPAMARASGSAAASCAISAATIIWVSRSIRR